MTTTTGIDTDIDFFKKYNDDTDAYPELTEIAKHISGILQDSDIVSILELYKMVTARVAVIEYRNNRFSQAEVSRVLGVDRSTATRYLNSSKVYL